MNKMLLTLALPLFLAAAAQAQTVVVETPREKRWTYTHSGCRPGYTIWNWGGTTGYGGFSYGGYTYYQGPVGYGLDPYGYGLYGGVGYYGGYGYRGGYFSRPAASADAAGPLPRTGPVADRRAEFASAREMDEGRARLRQGDYRGAVDQFRSAVASDTENPLAQAWFAVALAIAGDGKNADKALRSAAAAGIPIDRLTLADAFRDDKERSKVTASLARMSGEGALSAAFVLSLTGDPAKLKELAAKDPIARKLVPKP